MNHENAYEKLMSVRHQTICVPCGNDWLNTDDVTIENTNLIDFWGIHVNYDGTFDQQLLGGDELDMGFDEAILGTGEWSALYSAKVNDVKSHVIISDYFGFKSVFYSVVTTESGSWLIASNSFRAQLQKLEELGCPADINWPAASTTLNGRFNIFNMNSSIHTMANNVYSLRCDDVLVANDRGMGVIPRRRLIPASVANLSYVELLRRGIQRATRGVSSFTAMEGPEPILMLSGGKDSRSVLALVKAAGSQGSVGVRTHDPAIRPEGAMRDLLDSDLRIASCLVEKYSMHWAEAQGKRISSVSFDEYVEFWQKYRSGWNYVLSPGSTVSQPLNGHEVQFWGAGGELLRGYFSHQMAPKVKSWSEISALRHEPRAALSKFYEAIVPPDYTPPSVYQRAKGQFVDSLMAGHRTNATLDDVLNDYYRQFRNSAHFGNQNMAYALGTIQWYPLCQPEFLLATEKITVEERLNGKVQFDITEMLDPELNDWEYESGPWDESVGFDAKRYQAFSNPESALRKFWDHQCTMLRPSNVNLMASSKEHIESNKYDRKSTVFGRVFKNLQILKGNSSAVAEGIPEIFFGSLGHRAKASDLVAQLTLARTETLRDIVEIPRVSSYTVSRPRPHPGRAEASLDLGPMGTHEERT